VTLAADLCKQSQCWAVHTWNY